jgi:hypothetical protein
VADRIYLEDPRVDRHHYQYQQVQVTRQLSRFAPEKQFGSVPDLGKKPNPSVLVRLVPGLVVTGVTTLLAMYLLTRLCTLVRTAVDPIPYSGSEYPGSLILKAFGSVKRIFVSLLPVTA